MKGIYLEIYIIQIEAMRVSVRVHIPGYNQPTVQYIPQNLHENSFCLLDGAYGIVQWI